MPLRDPARPCKIHLLRLVFSSWHNGHHVGHNKNNRLQPLTASRFRRLGWPQVLQECGEKATQFTPHTVGPNLALFFMALC